MSSSDTTKQYGCVCISGVKELHVSVTQSHLQAVCMCGIKLTDLCSMYKDDYKHFNILLKVTVL